LDVAGFDRFHDWEANLEGFIIRRIGMKGHVKRESRKVKRVDRINIQLDFSPDLASTIPILFIRRRIHYLSLFASLQGRCTSRVSSHGAVLRLCSQLNSPLGGVACTRVECRHPVHLGLCPACPWVRFAMVDETKTKRDAAQNLALKLPPINSQSPVSFISFLKYNLSLYYQVRRQIPE
jgi:hypothetical protein